MALKFCLKYIDILGFFYFKLYLPFRYKKVKIFQGLYPMNPYQNSTMNPLWILYFTTFENSILIQKMDISRTAWINPWHPISVVMILQNDKMMKGSDIMVLRKNANHHPLPLHLLEFSGQKYSNSSLEFF